MNNTVRRAFFSAYMREARVKAGRTPAEASKLLNPNSRDGTKLSKIEKGKLGLKPAEARRLLDAYDVHTEEEKDYLEDLARTQSERGKWSGHRASVPVSQRNFYDFEEEASAVNTYGMEMVPGLLQAEPYMRAILNASPRVLAGNIENIVSTRLERQQQALAGDNPVDLAFVLSESCLKRSYGGNGVMQAQMGHLIAVSQRPNVRVQILPFDAPNGAAPIFGFTLLKIPPPRPADLPLELVYCENLHDADYVDDPTTLADYLNLWGHLTSGALNREDSRRLVLHYAQDYL